MHSHGPAFLELEEHTARQEVEGSVGGNRITGKVFTDCRTTALLCKACSRLATRGLVWLVWASAVPQAVGSSMQRDS